MKIAWFVPMDRSNAMGGYFRRVCEELIRRGHEVDIFSPVGEQYYDTAVNVILFRESTFDTAQLEQYDHVVYNMGNNVKWHYDIWEVMKRFPGKVILHDRIMVDFFYMLYHDPEWGGGTAEKLNEYERLMKEFYGSAGCRALDQFFARENTENEDILNTIMQYSMVSVILHYATGVFTHSGQFCRELKDSFFGPIGHAFLPCLIREESAGRLPEPFGQDDGRVLMISTGDVQRLKRIHIVAEVLMENPELAKKVRYALIGRARGEYGEALRRLSENELKGCLYLLGFQEDDVMNAFLREAEIAVNLRYPNSEVGSLSLLEQMACENATVVLNTGFFAEMPENADAMRLKR